MSTLAANKPRSYGLGPRVDLPVAASTKIFQGSAVGLTAGYARALVAGDQFHGFAETLVDNSAGAAASLNLPVIQKGVVVLPITGVAVTDVGKPVYASDDDTFTLTKGSNSLVGRVVERMGTDSALVAFDVQGAPYITGVTALTDNTGGSATSILAAITADVTYAQADMVAVKNGLASLTAKVNAIVAELH